MLPEVSSPAFGPEAEESSVLPSPEPHAGDFPIVVEDQDQDQDFEPIANSPVALASPHAMESSKAVVERLASIGDTTCSVKSPLAVQANVESEALQEVEELQVVSNAHAGQISPR